MRRIPLAEVCIVIAVALVAMVLVAVYDQWEMPASDRWRMENPNGDPALKKILSERKEQPDECEDISHRD